MQQVDSEADIQHPSGGNRLTNPVDRQPGLQQEPTQSTSGQPPYGRSEPQACQWTDIPVTERRRPLETLNINTQLHNTHTQDRPQTEPAPAKVCRSRRSSFPRLEEAYFKGRHQDLEPQVRITSPGRPTDGCEIDELLREIDIQRTQELHTPATDPDPERLQLESSVAGSIQGQQADSQDIPGKHKSCKKAKCRFGPYKRTGNVLRPPAPSIAEDPPPHQSLRFVTPDRPQFINPHTQPEIEPPLPELGEYP